MPVVSDSELTRRQTEILEGARRCFAEFGYEGATVRRLEEATGKSRGAIFHHFGDKERLFLALAREDAARQAARLAGDPPGDHQDAAYRRRVPRPLARPSGGA